MGCYTNESPFICEMCENLIINAEPVGVDSGLLEGVKDGMRRRRKWRRGL